MLQLVPNDHKMYRIAFCKLRAVWATIFKISRFAEKKIAYLKHTALLQQSDFNARLSLGDSKILKLSFGAVWFPET